MQAELILVKAFLTYSTWEAYHDSVTTSDFPEDLQVLHRVLDSWHKTQNPSQTSLHLLDFAAIFFAQCRKNKGFYEGVFDSLKSYEPNLDAVGDLVISIKRNKQLKELSILSYEVAEGRKQYAEVDKLLATLGETSGSTAESKEAFITDDLTCLLATTYQTPGLRWRLQTLNRSLGSLRKGDFGIVFARPETGKTTFLASEVSFMAQTSLSPILWINNEEVNEKVKMRIIQAALGVSQQDFLLDPNKHENLYKGILEGKILLPNESSYSKTDVEKLCKKYPLSLIVIDQLDKITGFKDERDDLKLGAIYQWARELAKTYCPVIGVTQADGTAEGKKWLTMANVANAKTAKQAEADWILGIGAISDTGWEDIRFLNISKNKLSGDPDTDPALRHGKMEVRIKPVIARYGDMK